MNGSPPLRFANYLSPVLDPTWQHIVDCVGEQLGITTQVQAPSQPPEIAAKCVDVAWLCGLCLVRTARLRRPDLDLEVLVAPVLHGNRYGGRPIYFSDVVTRRNRSYTCFEDLRGSVFARNQVSSHSGSNVVAYTLVRRGYGWQFFGEVVDSGSHLRSLALVASGVADAAAIDSHVLDVITRQNSDLLSDIHVIDSLGPSSIPPIVVRSGLDATLKQRMRAVLASLPAHPVARDWLADAAISRFVPVANSSYSDVRAMLKAVELAEQPGIGAVLGGHVQSRHRLRTGLIGGRVHHRGHSTSR